MAVDGDGEEEAVGGGGSDSPSALQLSLSSIAITSLSSFASSSSSRDRFTPRELGMMRGWMCLMPMVELKKAMLRNGYKDRQRSGIGVVHLMPDLEVLRLTVDSRCSLSADAADFSPYIPTVISTAILLQTCRVGVRSAFISAFVAAGPHFGPPPQARSTRRHHYQPPAVQQRAISTHLSLCLFPLQSQQNMLPPLLNLIRQVLRVVEGSAALLR